MPTSAQLLYFFFFLFLNTPLVSTRTERGIRRKTRERENYPRSYCTLSEMSISGAGREIPATQIISQSSPKPSFLPLSALPHTQKPLLWRAASSSNTRTRERSLFLPLYPNAGPRRPHSPFIPSAVTGHWQPQTPVNPSLWWPFWLSVSEK